MSFELRTATLNSVIWHQPDHVRLVWLTLVALMDGNHAEFIEGSR